jgi:hypothetical protein
MAGAASGQALPPGSPAGQLMIFDGVCVLPDPAQRQRFPQ